MVGLPGFEPGLNPPKGLVLAITLQPEVPAPSEGIEPPYPA